MPAPLVAAAGIGAVGNLLGGLFGRPKTGIDFNALNRLQTSGIGGFGGRFLGTENQGRFTDFYNNLLQRSGQKNYLTPTEFASYLQQRISPGLRTLGSQYESQLGQGMRGLVSDYASRGQLYGGSLTGASAQLQGQLGRGYADQLANLLEGAQSHLTDLDLQLGAQGQSQAQQQQQALLQAILGGLFTLPAIARRG